MTAQLKPARIGEICNGSLRTQDLIVWLAQELEAQTLRNGACLSLPENRSLRDNITNALGEANDAWNDDESALRDEESAAETVQTLSDLLQNFCAPYCTFGAHEGDGACFGYWPDINAAREGVAFVSRKGQDYPPEGEDFTGEWLHINERGNCTLYLRESREGFGYVDRELWSVV